MRYLLLLLTVSCAAPQREYHQGAYRPVAPTFVPSQDAPHTVGQPGHVRPDVYVEPGPRPSRVLPQTPATAREPGLWGGDEPTTTAGPAVLGILLWAPDEPRSPDSAQISSICGTMIDAGMGHAKTRKAAEALAEDKQECFVAKMLLFCAEELGKTYPSPTDATFKRIMATKKTAHDWTRRACNDDTESDTVKALLRDTQAVWPKGKP
jgi:hypothetical protein